MTNKEIARPFKLLAQLLELHQEDFFRAKSIKKAAESIAKSPRPLDGATPEELAQVPGIGKSTASKIVEYRSTGQLRELEELLAQTPEGLVTLMQVKGIGPKKAATFWKELKIDNLGALWYACKEDKVSKLKGFGAKTQRELFNVVEFTISNEGKFRLSEALVAGERIAQTLKSEFPDALCSATGRFRRNWPVLDHIEFILGVPVEAIQNVLQSLEEFSDIQSHSDYVMARFENKYSLRLFSATPETFYSRLLETTGSGNHVEQLKVRLQGLIPAGKSEAQIYEKAGLQFIPAARREGMNEFAQAENHNLLPKISLGDIKGSLHNHSDWSDGVNSIEEMALYCKETLKLEYLGLSDHSQTAVYAGGLKTEQVLAQWEEIERLNQKLAPFKIFRGIESDILASGALDYEDEVLAGFDFVVASVHSQLTMDKNKATARLIKAIENPYTTILGHPTGRQLLIRKGYEIDHKKVIDACAANEVVIEINANPLRLDIDWRWIPYCIEKGVMLSINPDAHSLSDLHYTEMGLLMAQKGGLEPQKCLNTRSLEEITAYFENRRNKIKKLGYV